MKSKSKSKFNLKSESSLLTGITMGCPAGIGPEIILKAADSGSLNLKDTIVFGDYGILNYYKNRYKLNIEFNLIEKPDEDFSTATRKLNIIDFQNCESDKIKFGESSGYAGKASLDYIIAAVDFAQRGKIAAVVTCPINKDAIHSAGCGFPGHTELLGYLTGCKNFGMMLAGKYLRVLLVTTHLAVKDVSKQLTAKKIFDIILLAHNSLRRDFNIKNPKIAVLALNPHCGENGLFGDEEKRIISPAINKAKAKGISAAGPYPADTLFPKVENNFDCVVCMYHDQGLIPLKLLSFGGGVNITLGLPIVRTSVDHGTGYDIVGKNKAVCGSLIEAVKLARTIALSRHQRGKYTLQ